MNESSRPTPPEYLDAEAILEWERVVGELEANGRLEKVDRVSLAMYVGLWATHRDAVRHVMLKGSTHTLPNGYRQATPEYDIMMKTQQQIRAWMKEFMATRASRAKPATPAAEQMELEF